MGLGSPTLMIYKDKFYGEFEITEPVLIELINSPWMQRLKGIDQAGYRPLWAKPNANITPEEHNRFTHSMGVFLLLRKYNASIEEQIAGLLHDVSHSAFSHCIDYVLDVGSQKEQNHQDNTFDKFIRKTDIPTILAKYGFNLEYILDDKNFPLKETKLPDLCADRLDYSFRDAVIFEEITPQEKDELLANLVAINGNWAFKTPEFAEKYAQLFRTINHTYYSGMPSAVMFAAVGECLRYALQKGYISEADLYQTDRDVLQKVQTNLASDNQLQILWDKMNGKIKAINNSDNFDAQVFCKSRIVNPLFIDGKNFTHLSDVKPEWSDIIQIESKPKQYFLKFQA